jgi:hypothetical protein
MRSMLLMLLMLQAAGNNSCFGPDGEINIPGVTTCTDRSIGRISVSSGLTPDISWASICRAHKLSVYVAATDQPVWDIDGTFTQAFADPVTYGVVPAGVTESHAADALQGGTRYGVRVVRYHETTADSIIGTATFTP